MYEVACTNLTYVRSRGGPTYAEGNQEFEYTLSERTSCLICKVIWRKLPINGKKEQLTVSLRSNAIHCPAEELESLASDRKLTRGGYGKLTNGWIPCNLF
ncbi:hypothetical protein RB195_001190 [Necator americanus]|uniref:Uncharacterized protein n=1 Tax=Necator americanus TaxID=51031 RepID=A0ABR1DDY5_NECAM